MGEQLHGLYFSMSSGVRFEWAWRSLNGPGIMALTDVLTSWRDVMTEAVRADGPDLSMRQWSILLTVYLTPGPHTVRALARELNVPKPAISRALDALSILGFIKRVRDADDKRIVIVQKTTEGAIYVDEFARLVELQSETPAQLGAMFG